MAEGDIKSLPEETTPAADDAYELQKVSGDADSSKQVKEKNIGIPGFYTQLGKGPTSVADNTAVAVLTGQVLAAGEIPIFYCGMKTTPTNKQRHTNIKLTDILNTTLTSFPVKQTSGNWDFMIKHKDGAARDFDWQVLKVAPV